MHSTGCATSSVICQTVCICSLSLLKDFNETHVRRCVYIERCSKYMF